MDERYSTQRLLVLRKLTRAIADLLRGQLKDYLATLAPLLRARTVLGDHVQSDVKEFTKGADAAYKDLQTLYEKISTLKPFGLTQELHSPLEVVSSVPEITPVEYSHQAKTDKDTKNITVTSPLKWVLTYSGFNPKRLKDLLAPRTRTTPDLDQAVLHYLMLHVVMSRQTGVSKILETLHFPVTTGRAPGFGELPVTYISSTLTTARPPDEVIIENTEVSGMDAFEELVDVEQIATLRDPLTEKLMELVKSQGEDLLTK